MSEALAQLLARLETMSVRERILVLVAGVGLLLAVWDTVALRPIQARSAELASEREGLEKRTETLRAHRIELERLLGTDPHADARTRQDELRAEIARVDETLRSHTRGLVQPQEMAQLLEELLAKRTSVQLMSLEALAPEPLASDDTAPGDEGAAAFKHGMRIELEGSFVETVAFIEEMERLPWSFFWDQLHYEVTRHPRAAVTLVVHTLSTREGWIGV